MPIYFVLGHYDVQPVCTQGRAPADSDVDDGAGASDFDDMGPVADSDGDDQGSRKFLTAEAGTYTKVNENTLQGHP